ncbi:hypothetical protein CEXT_802671 [Caerostris extrusa]|uniref:Uncharacterized protein n=1 Tax=Caerostris extrusa TaxID=172846 RepID=A0AAV4NU64_CAEEX|nr:hypothetical protein CEXT_802671 [Caerostris extrusa]
MKEDTRFTSMGTLKENHEASNILVNRLFGYGIADMPTTEILQSSQHVHVVFIIWYMKEDTRFTSMGTSKEDHEASNGIVNRLFWYGIADMLTTEILQSSQNMHVAVNMRTLDKEKIH